MGGSQEWLWCWDPVPVPCCADPDQCVLPGGPLATEVFTTKWPPLEPAPQMKPECGAL